MPEKHKWQDKPYITSTTEPEKETKRIKELVTTAIQCNETSEYHYLLSKYKLRKTLRILACIYRFSNNSRNVKKSGLLTTTEEIQRRRKYLIKQTQREGEHCEKIINNQNRLNLHKNPEGIY